MHVDLHVYNVHDNGQWTVARWLHSTCNVSVEVMKAIVRELLIVAVAG